MVALAVRRARPLITRARRNRRARRAARHERATPERRARPATAAGPARRAGLVPPSDGSAGTTGSADGRGMRAAPALAVQGPVRAARPEDRRPRRHHGNGRARWIGWYDQRRGTSRGRRERRHDRPRWKAAAGRGGTTGVAGQGWRPGGGRHDGRRRSAGTTGQGGAGNFRAASRRCSPPPFSHGPPDLPLKDHLIFEKDAGARRGASACSQAAGSAVATVDMAAADVLTNNDRRHVVRRLETGVRRRQYGLRHAAAEGARVWG